ncbi:COA8 family protein CG14806, mitochondrial [Vespa velutina]|uniref:COA8 family protein CG14806, mitochondrial n=1 Tax=Vespa velutina TaxID=202808 RepID=UPI001FB50D3A|nr:COA8 family protein CG14806, mitochondrial [Vespa velutina]
MSNRCTFLFRKYPVKTVRPFCSKSSIDKAQNEVNFDQIGKPDPVSNLRPIIFKKSLNESKLEKKYREAREDIQLWNQTFWTKHNKSFVQERNKFQETLKAQGKTSLTADEMSVFYKYFLDKNWRLHFDYNILWYKKNFNLLFLELRVKISKLIYK